MDLNATVLAFFSDPFRTKECVKSITEKLHNGETTFHDVIEALESKITSSESEDRKKACQLLKDVLKGLNPSKLKEAETSNLCEFFCAKLKDHYSMHPDVLQALLTLSESNSLTSQQATSIINSLFQEVHIQSCFQSVRGTVYQLLGNLHDHHADVIMQMGQDFVYNLVKSVEGEVDPRNLMLVFQLWHQLLIDGVQLGKFTEEAFEVVSCYFPIDFNPPPNDKEKPVTCEDLVTSLRKVLSATPDFANFCVPLMIEKMESDVQSAKLDACLTLTECLKIYYKSQISKFLSTIWKTVRREVQQAMSEEVEKAGLDLLEELVRVVSSWPADEDRSLEKFLQDVVDDCLPSIEQQKTDKQAWMCCLMLLACNKASEKAHDFITKITLPIVLKEIDDNLEEISLNEQAKMFVLDKVQTPFNVYLDLLTVVKNKKYKLDSLRNFEEKLLQLPLKAIRNNVSDQASCTAISCIATLISINSLTKQQVELVVKEVVEALGRGDCKNNVRHELLLVTGVITKSHPEVVEQNLYPKLAGDLDSACQVEEVSKILNSLSAICTDSKILSKVLKLVVGKFSKSLQSGEASGEYLKCLEYVSSKSDEAEVLKVHCLLPLLKICVEFSDERDSKLVSHIKILASIFNSVGRKLTEESAEKLYCLLDKLFSNGDASAFNIKKSNFSPFDCSSEKSLMEKRTVCLLCSYLCSLKPSVHVESKLFDKLLNEQCSTTDQMTYVWCSKAIASILNKAKKAEEVKSLLDKIKEKIMAFDWSNETSEPIKMRQLTLVIWALKSVAMRNDRSTVEMMQALMGVLGDDDVGNVAAAGFDIIMRDSEQVLSVETHATRRLMYKQRFFSLFMPRIRNIFDSNESSQLMKANCLSALSNVLAHIPRQVLLQQMKELIPLLLHSLQSQQVVFLKSVLKTLFSLIQDAPDIMKNYVETLMKSFLNLVNYKEDMHVRQNSLRCVGICSVLPDHVILPMRGDVIKSTGRCLDDRKRVVRQEASKCRSQWYLVGQGK